MPKPKDTSLGRTFHMGHQVNQHGAMSALCFLRPRAINMKTSTWTIPPSAVTCLKCLAILAKRKRKTKTNE